MFSKAASLFALVSAAPALAKIFVTAPVATTTWPVGQDVTIQWQDDNATPLLANIGVCDVGIYAGNTIQQTLLQDIGTLNVSVNNSLTFKVNADIGPSGKAAYFIRFTATNFQDPATPQFPYEAFSAMFTLSGATGTFNSTVQAQVDGVSTAGTVGASTTAAASAATSAASSASAAKTTPSASASANKTNSTGTSAAANASGAAPRFVMPALLTAGAAAVLALAL